MSEQIISLVFYMFNCIMAFLEKLFNFHVKTAENEARKEERKRYRTYAVKKHEEILDRLSKYNNPSVDELIKFRTDILNLYNSIDEANESGNAVKSHVDFLDITYSKLASIENELIKDSYFSKRRINKIKNNYYKFVNNHF